MNQESKLYQPSKRDIRNPFIVIPFFILLDFVGIKYFIEGLMILLSGGKINILLWIFYLGGAIFITYMIYVSLVFSPYITVFAEYFIGKNSVKMKIAEMKYNDINEIYVKRKSYDIIIADVNGKKVIINTAIEYVEELLNLIISRAVNCTRIDLKRLQKEYPNISVYTRG